MKKREMIKSAQISLFIIIAIILVVLFLFLFISIKGSGDSELGNSLLSRLGIKSDVDIIKNSIVQCMKKDSRDALRLIGIQGGFYKKPGRQYELDWAFIPYYYDKGQILMPSKERIESELSAYMDDNFVPCLNELDFKNYDLSYGISKTETLIMKNKVIFTIDLPVSVKKGDKVTMLDLEKSPVTYNSSLFDILEVSKYITDSHQEDPNMICINCVVNMAKERRLYVDMLAFPYASSTTLVMISENYTSPEPYLFEFLNGY